jgi:cell division protein YceG involved in septum cleavage
MKTLKSYHKEHIDKMKKIKRVSFGIFSILLILFVFIFVKMYNSIITPNISTKGNYSLYIYSNDDFETIKNKLYSDSIIINKKSFEWVAKKLDYPKYIK